MNSHRITFEHGLYGLAFLLALGLRFVHLGAMPLSDLEAGWAMQALQVSGGARPTLSPHPAYILLTSLTFFVFGATNFLSRFWPAIIGGLLVLSPYFFRDRLGRFPALILAFVLAIDPGLLALSRQAGSSILSITFLIFTWAMWRTRHDRLAGLFAGLSLLSGSSFWMGLLGLVLTWAISKGFENKPSGRVRGSVESRRNKEERKTGASFLHQPLDRLKSTIGWCLGTLLLGGTLFFVSPNGLSALAAALPEYVRGWWTPSIVPARLLLIALPAYLLMAMVFGLVAAVRGWVAKNRDVVLLSFWVLVTFLLALVYPARQVGDLAWAIVPLWVLAAIELGRHFDLKTIGVWELIGVTALTFGILTFIWTDLSEIAATPVNPFASTAATVEVFGRQIYLPAARYVVFIGALLLFVLSHLLISLGWSEDVSRLGAVWGGGLALLIFTLSMALSAAGLRKPSTVDLWQPWPHVVQSDILLQTVEDLSEWNRGHIQSLDVAIVGTDSPAMKWLFRDWSVTSMEVLSAVEDPALVIAPQEMELDLPSSFRGQDFVWHVQPSWDLATGADWLRWFVFREFPKQTESVVLWTRQDLFLDGGTLPITP